MLTRLFLQYGMIKKIEHFWKGLSHDRNQISALPPEQYGERFINFISGITTSIEEAQREAQEREAAAAAAAAAEQERIRSRRSGSMRRRSTVSYIPPMPSHQPPPPPGMRSPEAEATVRKAEREAWRDDPTGTKEDAVPNMVLRTKDTPGATLPAVVAAAPSASATAANKHGSGSQQRPSPSAGGADRDGPHRELAASHGQVLPVVEEAAEGGSTHRGGGLPSPKPMMMMMASQPRGPSQASARTAESSAVSADFRPLTPAKDGEEQAAGFGNPVVGYHPGTGTTTNGNGNSAAAGVGGGIGPVPPDRRPPTPPKSSHHQPPPSSVVRKAESADSGYGEKLATPARTRSGSPRNGHGGRVKAQVSRGSLDKELPPLPSMDGVS